MKEGCGMCDLERGGGKVEMNITSVHARISTRERTSTTKYTANERTYVIRAYNSSGI